MILPAIIIKLHCFKLIFETHFCLNHIDFVFSIMDNHFDFGCHRNIGTSANFKQIEQKIPDISHFHFFMSSRIASVMSYLSENLAENLQNGVVHLGQIPDVEVLYLENYLAH